VDRHEVVALASASTLPLLRRKVARSAAKGTIAIVADPVFSADDPRVAAAGRAPGPGSPAADMTREALTRLPFSRIEASAVASQAPSASVLQAIDFDATVDLATSGRLNDYRIVHLATHGVIDTARPELSALALSLVDRDGRPRDGFLRLNTIYNLRLAADLVVLSACQTALGREVAGEGLVGLTRGFMHAGARQVIASLWQVNDAATADLMRLFYRGLLQERLSAPAALRRAQRELAANPRWSAPYYWAGFVLQGDWQP
jgi:CHAT domain-containing protein